MNTQEAGEKVRQGRSVSTEQDSVRRLAEIRVAYEAADDFTRARMGNVKWMIDCIDSHTAERDQLRLMFNTEYRVAAIESGLRARAEAAEADRERLREALGKVRDFQYDDRLTAASAYAMCRIADAALATPPSEGQS